MKPTMKWPCGAPGTKIFSTALAAALLCTPLPGQKPDVAKSLGPPTTAGSGYYAHRADGYARADGGGLGAYLDGIVPQQLKRENLAGAVVLVVKDGHVLFQRGYGYADVAAKVPMSPDDTIIRPGSTSKLFTWTAVMQQVELGKIDLDRERQRTISISRFPRRTRSHHDARSDDAHGRFRRSREGSHRRSEEPAWVNWRLPAHPHAAAHLRSGNDPRLLELWRHACRVHCAARVGCAFCGVRAEEHLYPAEHAAQHL